jgi:hypothetical protein
LVAWTGSKCASRGPRATCASRSKGFDRDTRERLHMALHGADRKIGVILHGTDFVLLTWEPDETSAREYARAILDQAAAMADISPDAIARVPISDVSCPAAIAGAQARQGLGHRRR